MLSEVEKLCKEVAIINKGKLLAEDTMENLRKKLTKTVELEVEISQVKEEITKDLSSFDFVQGMKQEGNLVTLRVKSDRDYRAQISETIAKQGGIVL